MIDEESLGVGMGFTSEWDFEVKNGSIILFQGLETLQRDLSLELQDELDDERGVLFNVNSREDIRIVADRILRQEERINEFDVLDVRQSSETLLGVEIEFEAEVETGGVASFIITNNGGN